MDWTSWGVIIAAIIAFLIWKRMSLISVAEARQWLRQGAKVIDVRSESEFRQEHLPNTVNLPLGSVRSSISTRFPNKDEPLLLHCLSGGRSGLAKRMLKGMGYRRVANLGSYSRARRVVSEQ